MKQITGKQSSRKVVTDANKLPDNVGFGGAISGYTRTLTPKERKAQRDIMNHKKYTK